MKMFVIALVCLFPFPVFAQKVVIHGLNCPEGRRGNVYVCALAATTEKRPSDWSATAKSLPKGLQLYVTEDASKALVYGTPGVSEKLSLKTGTALAIISPPCKTNYKVGVVYLCQLVVSGGTPPYNWAVISGSLPPGLVLYKLCCVNTPAAVIFGTPTK